IAQKLIPIRATKIPQARFPQLYEDLLRNVVDLLVIAAEITRQAAPHDLSVIANEGVPRSIVSLDARLKKGQ
ncbi:MAG: hypothetical protein U1E51_34815, partial [Candidatus Binatia bacterium]|nr:hypothetical protein [Candidatus Binatia bacterium]